MLAEFSSVYPTRNKYVGSEKLMLTQFSKTNYIVHFKVLQFYLSMGMRISKIHRGAAYTQAPYFRPYIEYNSKKRQEATDDLMKEF